MLYVIPLTSDPDQYFSCNIPVDTKNITLFFRVRYNTVAEYWTATIANSTGTILIDSLPLFRGVYPDTDLLGQHKHLEIGSAYIIRNGKVNTDQPDSSTLGSDFLLVWGDT